jgi:PAS domain S-box-containing protein
MTFLKYLYTFIKRPDKSLNYPDFLDTLNDVVLLINKTQQIEYVNQCWEQISGCSKQKTQGRYLPDFLHPEDKILWQQTIRKLDQKNTSQHIWIRFIGIDNEIRWCEMRIQSMHPNQIYPLSATLCDITPLVRKDQLKNAHYRSLTGLVNRIPAMIYRARNDKNWTMEYVSDGCMALSGYTTEQLLNQSQLSFGSLIHPEDASNVWAEVQIALEHMTGFELTYRLFHESGDCQYVLEKGAGIYSNTGAILGVEGVIIAVKSNEQREKLPH